MIRLRARHWGLAIICTFVLYLVAAVALLWRAPAPVAAVRLGVGGIQISLDTPAGRPVVKAAGEPLLAQTEMSQGKQIQGIPAPTLKTESQPEPASKIIHKPAPKPVQPQPRPKPEPAKKSKPQPAEAKQAQADSELAAQKTAAGAGTHTDRNIGSVDQAPDGGQMGNNNDYMLKLQTWLERHKTYPRRAKRRHQQGTVLVYFVMDRQGNVLHHEIRQSSGHKLLDKEVTNMLKRAQPLPPLPASISGNQMEWIVPVKFALR